MKDFSSGPWYNASTVTPTEQSTKPETLTTPWDLFKFKDSILQNLEQKYSQLHESLVSLIYYSLRPKNKVILGFKICPKKQVILPYLESAWTCKNQLVLNMGDE